MKPMTLDKARRLAAQTEAYSWYCQAKGVPDPDEQMDNEVLVQHARAWAWARRNWRAFLAATNSPDSQFLIDLFHRGRGACRRKSGRGRVT